MIQLVLPKAFSHFDCATLQPSAACNSSQRAWLQLELFSEDGKIHTLNRKNWGMTAAWRKCCWISFKLGQKEKNFCSLFTEIVEIIFHKCSVSLRQILAWHLGRISFCSNTVRGESGWGAPLRESRGVVVGSYLNVSLWCALAAKALVLRDQRYSPQIKRRDCLPLCNTHQTTSRYSACFWDLMQERRGQIKGTSGEGP